MKPNILNRRCVYKKIERNYWLSMIILHNIGKVSEPATQLSQPSAPYAIEQSVQRAACHVTACCI